MINPKTPEEIKEDQEARDWLNSWAPRPSNIKVSPERQGRIRDTMLHLALTGKHPAFLPRLARLAVRNADILKILTPTKGT